MTVAMLLFSMLAGGLGAILVDQLTARGMPGHIGSGALGGVCGGSQMLARAPVLNRR